ncbi:ATP-binding protein [Caballeronia hypogeia]|uniref:ATP-binding protein n=1 Tax=Caballeronia hypogeia TaxID=1777140 RepID=UPI00077217A0|nr:hybrid sensor histidine kinase/response regulator [Caballeronia hypogeia]
MIEALRQELALDLPDDPLTVLGDGSRLIQVLTNLLNNAAKYTQQGGRIALTAGVRDGQVAISVADNGIGVDAIMIRTALPGLDGHTLARQLHAVHPHERTLYIAVSDACQSHDKIVARGVGFDHHVERAVAMATLSRILHAVPT